ncbi:MAG: PorP/SprF family type IX secretion system membrane protein [Cyclobacteriaceae bacterium]
MKKKALTLTLIILSIFGFSQEGQFSQYFASTSILNPSFTGTNPNISFNTNFKRSGTQANESYFELLQATFTYPLMRTTSKDHQIGGVGVTFFRERRGFEGIYTAQKVLLSGAYAIKLAKLSNQSVIFGLQGGLVQNKIDGSGLQWGSQFSRYIGFDGLRDGETVNSSPIFYPTFNFGVIYSAFDNDNLYVRDKSILLGASIDNLNEPEVSQDGFGATQRYRVYRAFGSAKMDIAPRVYMHPSGYALYSRGNSQINAGMYFSTLVSSVRSKTAILLQTGAWYRFGDSIIVLGGFQIDNLRIGGSFDLNTRSFDINQALGNNLPSYEISLTYDFSIADTFRNISSPIF